MQMQEMRERHHFRRPGTADRIGVARDSPSLGIACCCVCSPNLPNGGVEHASGFGAKLARIFIKDRHFPPFPIASLPAISSPQDEKWREHHLLCVSVQRHTAAYPVPALEC